MNPAGTEIAGLAMNVTYQHERIQSMYVGIATPATVVGYSVVTSNGSTCVTGSTKYSYFSKKRRASLEYMRACRAAARATSAPVFRSASAISHLIVSLTTSGCSRASAA